MNGVHDMGGIQDMGAIPYEKDEPVFHEPWEGRVFALSRALRTSTPRGTSSNSFRRPIIWA